MTISLPRTLSSAGIAYHQCGDGPPVLLVHGVGLRAESWFPQIEALSKRHTVYAIDLPGLGETRLLDIETPTISDYASHVRHFIDDVIATPAIVIGHSLGALITVDLAINHPMACRAIAPLNAIFDRTPEALAAVQARAASLRHNIGKPWDPTLASAPVERWFGADPTGRDAEMAALCTGWLEANNLGGYAAAYTAFAGTSGPDRKSLATVTVPTLFLTGEYDPNSTPAMSNALADHIPGAQTVIVVGAAHMTGLTHSNEVNTALLKFLDEVHSD